MDDYQNKGRDGYQDGYSNGREQQGYYQNNQQNYYQNGQPYYRDPRKNRFYQDMEEPMNVGEWVLTLLITMIPCVNIIMLFVWAFGSGAKRSKSNWAKAALIFLLIGAIFSIILSAFGIITGISLSFLENYYY